MDGYDVMEEIKIVMANLFLLLLKLEYREYK